MNTEQALDRLRLADPYPEGLAAPSIEPVLRRLREDPPPGPALAPAPAFRRRPPLGTLLGALAVVGAVVAVVVSVGVVGGQRQGNSGAGRPAAHLRPAPWQHGALATQFAIVRHPLVSPPLAVKMARRLGLGPHSFELGQLVLHPRAGRTDLLLVLLHTTSGHSPERLSLVTIDQQARLIRPLESIYSPASQLPTVGFGVIDSLVPDWVTKVTWQLITRPGAPLRTIHARIAHNVAFAMVPSYVPGSLQVTWSGRGQTAGAAQGAAVVQRDCTRSSNGCEVPSCRASQLSARLAPGGGELYLSASGSTTCQLLGYPELSLRGQGRARREIPIRPAAGSSATTLVQSSVHGTPASIGVYTLRPTPSARCAALPPPLRLVVRLPHGGGELSVPVTRGEDLACATR